MQSRLAGKTFPLFLFAKLLSWSMHFSQDKVKRECILFEAAAIKAWLCVCCTGHSLNLLAEDKYQGKVKMEREIHVTHFFYLCIDACGY